MKRMLTLTSLFLLAGVVDAQTPATNPANTPASAYGPFSTQSSRSSSSAKKSALESAIDLALANNPDLRVADAKVREAEASMSRTRLQVLQKVVAAYQGIEDAKAAVKHAESGLALAKRLHTSGLEGSPEKALQAEAAISQAKSKQAAAQAELDYLQGKAAAKTTATGSASAIPDYYTRIGAIETAKFYLRQKPDPEGRYIFNNNFADRPTGSAADRLRKALEKKVTLKVETNARTYLAQLREQASGLHIQATEKGPSWDEKVSATLSEVPLSAAIQLLEDVLDDHRVVVRDYGLYIAPRAATPAGATTLADFLRASAPAETKPATPKK